MSINATASIAPDLTDARGEIEQLARRADAAGCTWARGDLELYFAELTATQRTDTQLLPEVLRYWRDRFRAAVENPQQRRPPFIRLIDAIEILRGAGTRLSILSRTDPQRFGQLQARLAAAADDREKALLLRSAESASQMLPSGLVLGQPAPPIDEAAKLLRSLRASGLSLALADDGRVAVTGGILSPSQRERLTALRAEIAQLISAPPSELI